MRNIVLVDDERPVHDGLGRLVSSTCPGWQVTQGYYSAQALLDALESGEAQPDLIISDICMPQMDGLGLLSALRSRGFSTEVILLSGYSEFSYAQQGIRYGVAAYLLKPVDEEELFDALSQVEARLIAKGSPASQELDDAGQNARICKALRFIHSHYAQDLPLALVSEQAGLNPNYFSNLFKKTCGQTFSEYLTAYRLERAADLLRNTDLKVYEISNQCGFREAKYFFRLFKKNIGMSPQQYRRKRPAGRSAARDEAP